MNSNVYTCKTMPRRGILSAQRTIEDWAATLERGQGITMQIKRIIAKVLMMASSLVGLLAGDPAQALDRTFLDMMDKPEFREEQSLGKKGYDFTGRHLIVSYYGCDPAALRDAVGIASAMKTAARTAGATILKTASHVFPPDGFTMVLLLSESHASIHTYPEHNACFVDLFTCGNTCRAEKFDEVMRGYLRPMGVDSRVLIRNHKIEEDSLRNVPAAVPMPRAAEKSL